MHYITKEPTPGIISLYRIRRKLTKTHVWNASRWQDVDEYLTKKRNEHASITRSR